MTENHLVAIEDGVATVTLNRPELHNAFDDALIAGLTRTFERLGAEPGVRVVVLRGAGKSFSAGGDLGWMRRMAGYTEAENLADATRLAAMLRALDTMARPTIAAVHGACFAGGTGLVACADIALCADDAVFCLSEVRLGLVPAMISPYVIRALGTREARRWFLTGEPMDAATALRIGLVHECVDDAALAGAASGIVAALLAGAPGAQAEIKRLVRHATGRTDSADEAMLADTARWIARVRAGSEAREGLTAFLERRKPGWIRGE
jgi:methylglutaconyl-CoA hydratase